MHADIEEFNIEFMSKVVCTLAATAQLSTCCALYSAANGSYLAADYMIA